MTLAHSDDYDWSALAQREHQEHAVACAEARAAFLIKLREAANAYALALPSHAIRRPAGRSLSQARGDHVESIVEAAMEYADEAIEREVAELME